MIRGMHIPVACRWVFCKVIKIGKDIAKKFNHIYVIIDIYVATDIGYENNIGKIGGSYEKSFCYGFSFPAASWQCS